MRTWEAARLREGFYDSTKWQRKRAAILRRDKFLCRDCARYGRHVAAVVAYQPPFVM